MNAIKPITQALAGLALAALAALSAQAADYDIPDSGLTQEFNWSNGIGAADDTFSITVAAPSQIHVVLTDEFLAGDTFKLKLDGNWVPFTSTTFVGSSNFQGTASGVYLGVGAHTFEIFLTGLSPGYGDGSGIAAFSALEAVPEPATYGMLLAGLGLLGYAARSKQA
ncbi:PEP-CTERM sorting domain-containing protein [Pseudoduganella sp. FT55W]|uniref:PEP-CTERM sorting domain-containing protein n=1 Tax=Duganella rivi TaxID=2666083 RepID=A0A7X4GPR2_9BURK|nr:FxDxF family PEP-CTERM protein [Duganella rivi]MYM67378.1 PEP-CTERM sorting domain-containing protein [Duganella rivi]